MLIIEWNFLQLKEDNMKELRILGLIGLLAISVVSCNTDSTEEKHEETKVEDTTPQLNDLVDISDSIAADLKKDIPRVELKKYRNAIARNIDIYSYYPKSEESAKAVDLVQGYATQIEDYALSVEWSEKLIKEYPEYKGRELILFNLANTCNLMTKDTIKAKKYFNMFIEEYPNSPLSADARFSVEHLGLSLEDIISGNVE